MNTLKFLLGVVLVSTVLTMFGYMFGKITDIGSAPIYIFMISLYLLFAYGFLYMCLALFRMTRNEWKGTTYSTRPMTQEEINNWDDDDAELDFYEMNDDQGCY